MGKYSKTVDDIQYRVDYFLRLGIQHPFKLHITLLTKLIVDVVSRRFQGPSPVLRGSTNKASAVIRPPQGGGKDPVSAPPKHRRGTLKSTTHYIYD